MDDDAFLKIIGATPLVAIDLIVRNRRQEVLLDLRRNRPAQGCWFVPGGRIHKNERIAAARDRIARAEIGCPPPPADVRLRGVYEHLYDDNFLNVDGIGTHYVVLAYDIIAADGIRLFPDRQHTALEWWHLSRLMTSDAVHPNTKAYFADSRRRDAGV
jgi:colanic acid biosynthesis protein WcaH